MLHVEQYRNPSGPPIGTPSPGIGALMGDETGGNIPGSIVAEIHKVIIVMAPNIALAQKMVSTEQNKSKNPGGFVVGSIMAFKWGMTMANCMTNPITNKTLVKNKDGASLPNMHLPLHKKA